MGTSSVATAAWYLDIIKPSWAPPAYVFGPVWTVLYILIAISFGHVAFLCVRRRLPFSVFLPFLLNLIFNLAYSPIQFVWHDYLLASIDIVLILGTILWFMAAVWRRVRWVALVNIPYFLWVSFATVLQLTITYLNR